MTGDLTLGTDKITLDATNGIATLAGGSNFGNRIAVTSGGFAFVAKETGGTTNKGALMNTGEFRIGPDVNNVSTLTARIQASGSAEFKSTVAVGDAAGNTYLVSYANRTESSFYSINNNANGTVFVGQNDIGTTSSIYANGSAEFSGGVTAGGVLSVTTSGSSAQVLATARGASSNNDIFLRGLDQNGDQTWGIESQDGSASFASNVAIGGYNKDSDFGNGIRLVKGGNVSAINIQGVASSIAGNWLEVYSGQSQIVRGGYDGSVEFSSRITSFEIEAGTALTGNGYGFYASVGNTSSGKYGAVVVKQDTNDSNGNSAFIALKAGGTVWEVDWNGNSTFSNAIFNLEPDNDANYVTTTDVDEDGNTVENRVYNGPTLDVKAVIQELQQRVADRDAVIADFTTRLAALEADHATLMSNNGGSY